MKISDLERPGFLQVIVFLYENRDKKVNVTDIERKVTAHRSTVLSVLEVLKVNGLIEEEIMKKFPCSHLVQLTPYGVEAAAQFFAASTLLNRGPILKTESDLTKKN